MKRIIAFFTLFVLTLAAVSARQPDRGYRGFVEWSNSLNSVDMWWPGNSVSTLHTGVTTSHGYQINPMFFVGAGIGLERCGKIDSYVAPVFVQGRADFQFGRFTPFGDIRLGYNLSQGGGLYFSPSIGYRFNWGRKVGVNIGVGLTVHRHTYDIYVVSDDSDYISYVKTGEGHGTKTYFSFRLGFDF